MGSLTTAAAHAQNGKSTHFSKIEKCTRYRLQISENGYEPLPAIGKKVYLNKWNSKPIDQTEIESWVEFSTWTNTSIRCHNVTGIDIDVEDQWLANSIVAFTRIELGNSPLERIGQAPRTLLVYRADSDDIRKHEEKIRYKNTAQKIEILGRGQQFVASGIHPDTRQEYKWTGSQNPTNTPIEDLPSLTSQDIDSYVLALRTFLKDQGCEVLHQKESTRKRPTARGVRIHPDFLKAALVHIPADDYDDWITMGMGIHHETNGSSAGLELWDDWSRSSGKYDESRENECEYKWQGFGRRSGGVTGASVLELAKKHGFDLARYIGQREDFSEDIVSLESDSRSNGHDHHPTPINDQTLSFPEQLLKPPGLVGMVAGYCNQSAFRDQPLLDICAGLVTVATLTRNWFVVGRWRTPINIYVVAVAESGEGKEAPRKAIKAALRAGNRLSSVKESASSSPALLRALSLLDRHDITLLIDEFGRFLNVAANPNNSHMYELVSELMRLYGQANTTYAGRIYANKKDNISSIDRPFVNLFGTTTSRSLTDALSSKDVVDGTLNRLLIVVIDNRQPAYKDPDPSLSMELETALQNFRQLDAFEFTDETDEELLDPRIIDVMPDAEEALTTYRDEVDKLRVASGNLGPLYARAFENAIKVAGILAVGCAAESGPIQNFKPVVDLKCAEWAISFVQWCVSRIVKIGAEEIADTNIERAINKIRNYLINMTTDWEGTKADRDDRKREMNLKGYVSKAQICKRFQKMAAKVRNDAIQTLIDSEDIQCVRNPYDTSDSTEWFTLLRDR